MNSKAGARVVGGNLRCRVCLSTAAQRTLLPLNTRFPRLESSLTHLECFRSCTQLEVPVVGCSISDADFDFKYPMQICLRCSKALQVAYHFKRLATESDATLRAECAEALQMRQIKEELMEVGLGVTSTHSDRVDLTSFFKEITAEKSEEQTQTWEEINNRRNAFSSEFSDFVKRYEVTQPLKITELDYEIEQSQSNDKNTHNNNNNKLLDIAKEEEEEEEEAEVESVETQIEIDTQIFQEELVELLETNAPNKENVVAQNIEVLEITSKEPSNDMELELEQEECNKDDTLEDAIKILSEDIESNAQEISTSCERDVLAKIDNQSATTTLAKTIPENGNLSLNASKFIEEIKENLSNGVRDFALLRNKTKVLGDTEELQKAFETKEAEVDDNNELICVLCDKRFIDMRTFIRHRNRHKGITPFRCNTCNFFTCYSESLRKHYKREHDIEATNEMLNTPIDPKNTPMEKPYVESTYRCSKCDFETHEYEPIRQHIEIKHQMLINCDVSVESLFSTAFNCPDCHRIFKDQKSMRTHFTFMHGSSFGIRKQSTETYICEHCDKQFYHKVSLVSHQRVCRLREAVGCHICNKKLVSVRVFEQHLRAEHDVETIHECEVCSKRFNSREALFKHRKRHTERHFQCSLCPKTYINNSELNTHIARMHCTGSNVLCRICGQKYPNLRLLREHENKEHKKKLLKCQYCDYTSPWGCAVRLHEYTHTGKPYKCATCGRQFALRSYLRRHSIKAHSITPTDEEMAEMFRKKFGYPSRYDVFSSAKDSLEITEFNEEDIEKELNEFGLKFEDIVNELFENGVEDELFNFDT